MPMNEVFFLSMNGDADKKDKSISVLIKTNHCHSMMEGI